MYVVFVCLCVCVCMSRCEEALKMFGQKKAVTAFREILEIWRVLVYIYLVVFVFVCAYRCIYTYVFIYICVTWLIWFTCVWMQSEEKAKEDPELWLRWEGAERTAGDHKRASGVWEVTHSYVRRDSFICVAWRIYTCDVTHSHGWHDSLTLELAEWCADDHKRASGVCEVTHSHVWHESFTCVAYSFASVAWLIHVCDITHSRGFAASIVGDRKRASGVCDMRHSCVWHDSLTCVIWLIHVDLLSVLWTMIIALQVCMMCINESHVYKWVTCV